jgi:hypothetical protein
METTKVVATITIHPTVPTGFTWVAELAGQTGEGTGEPEQNPTNAVWRAVDWLRAQDDTLRGNVRIISVDGTEEAICPVYVIPTYYVLPWKPAQHRIDLDRVATATDFDQLAESLAGDTLRMELPRG